MNPSGEQGAVACFDEIADELYERPPTDFTTLRDEHVRRLRAAGDRKTATAVSKLRRPTQAAWLINVLWREHRDAVEELLELAEPLRAAQERRDGTTLRNLSAERRQRARELTDLVTDLAENAGVRVTADLTRAVGETLDAALADPEVAQQVRTGRMVQTTSYAGFGFGFPTTGDTGTDAPKDPAETKKASTKRRGSKKHKCEADEGEREDEAAAARQRAEQRLAEATEALEDAVDDLETREEELRQATEQRDELKERIEALRRKLDELKGSLNDAEREVRRATRRHERAAAEHERAKERAERAREELGQPST